MIGNARMYTVSAHTAELWRALLSTVTTQAGMKVDVIEHAPPAAIEDLWRRTDMAAVFMCGLPYSCARSKPALIAAPVPSAEDFAGRPEYWSELVVRSDSPYQDIEATFGARLALTAPNSQSGYAAALQYLMTHVMTRMARDAQLGVTLPLYREVIAPTVTPLGAITAVISGAADVAPVDAYAYRLLQRYRSDLTSKLRTVARTARTPIPPLVASIEAGDALRSAFAQAHGNPKLKPLMADLELAKFLTPKPVDYDALRVNFQAARVYWREHPLAAIVHPAFAV
ncbi:MAG TPA: PhnD/SsuA/transferrin family substrate-binding protein [Steroidobacteraceae bacterium]